MRRAARGRLWLWAFPLLGALILASRATGAWPAGALTSSTTPAKTENCARCHEAIAREWSASQHASSADELFRTAAAAEPARAFCENCHRGSQALAEPGQRALAVEQGHAGIGCVSCHGRMERGLFGHRYPDGAGKSHAELVGRECAGCHEFAFPGERSKPELMQLTLSEHAASSFAGTRCVDCHMPVLRDGLGSHRSHAFADTRDDAKLSSALRVVAERSGATNATVTLRSQRVGHAFPTGDLFRRLVVEVEALGDDFAVVASARRDLSRHFADTTPREGGHERHAVGDDRVPADGERRVELELGDAAQGRRLIWRVRYERVLHLNPRHEADARVDSSVLLASGELPEKP